MSFTPRLLLILLPLRWRLHQVIQARNAFAYVRRGERS